jgi:NitT/TauT family transport system ATP-binding protein
MNATNPKVTLDHLSVSLGGNRILDDISLTVDEHEFVCIIGTSGGGKTTLLRSVAGLLAPAGGTVRLDGEDVLAPTPRISMVFQHFGLFPWKTVRANVEYGLRVQGRIAQRDRVDRLLEIMNLTHVHHLYPHQLSGGMKQRVAIARALALEPTLLLMDEPFGSLDAITRQRLQAELNRIVEQTDVTLMFVTHSIEEALILGDRVVVLSDAPSKVLEIADVRDLGGPETPEYGAMRGKLRDLLAVDRELPEEDDGSVD